MNRASGDLKLLRLIRKLKKSGIANSIELSYDKNGKATITLKAEDNTVIAEVDLTMDSIKWNSDVNAIIGNTVYKSDAEYVTDTTNGSRIKYTEKRLSGTDYLSYLNIKDFYLPTSIAVVENTGTEESPVYTLTDDYTKSRVLAGLPVLGLKTATSHNNKVFSLCERYDYDGTTFYAYHSHAGNTDHYIFTIRIDTWRIVSNAV